MGGSGLAQYVTVIAGREAGNKKSIIGSIKTGMYFDSHAIMIGDALGDLEAAKANNILFYPITPGREASSWKRFFEEGFDKFTSNKYSTEYENSAIAEFKKILMSRPPWEKVEILEGAAAGIRWNVIEKS